MPIAQEPVPPDHAGLKLLFLMSGFNLEANKGAAPRAKVPRRQLDVRMLFHNVQSLASAAFRRQYLAGLAKQYHVVALAETFAKQSDEAIWQRDWEPRGTA